jgi:4-carboxymuconolactone decarboxylase
MSRLEPLRLEELTPEQERLYHHIVGTRAKGLDGPFGIWLRVPRIGEPCEKLQNAFRLSGALDRRLAELLILLVAREWSSQYAWYLHEKLALTSGLSTEIVAAIRDCRRPRAMRPDEQVVYDFVTELLSTKTVQPESYEQASRLLGTEKLIEMVGAVGFYAMACMTLNVFDVPIPADATPLR